MLRPMLPKSEPAPDTGNPSGVVPPAGMTVAGTNADVLKYWPSREVTSPLLRAVAADAPEAKLARDPPVLYNDPPSESLTLNGTPDCSVMIPVARHPPSPRESRLRPCGPG